MNEIAERTVIDLDNMAMHVQFTGGEMKLAELLQRAARIIEKLNKAVGSDDEATRG